MKEISFLARLGVSPLPVRSAPDTSPRGDCELANDDEIPGGQT